MYVKYLRNSTIYLVIGSPFRVLVVLRRDDPRFHMWVESLNCNSQLLESHSPQLGSKVGEENNPQTPFLFSLALIFLERHCLSLTCANSNLSVNFYYRALCIPMTQEGSICPVVSSDIVCVGWWMYVASGEKSQVPHRRYQRWSADTALSDDHGEEFIGSPRMTLHISSPCVF